MRRFVSFMLGAVVVASVGACSSNNTASTSNTAAPTTTAAKTGDTKSGGSSGTKASGSTKKAPTVTKPTTTGTVDKAKVPPKANKATQVSGLSQDEQDCIDAVVVSAVTDDPTIADNDAQLAGLVGGTLVVCVPQSTLASGLTALIKQASPSVTDAQAQCIESQFATADPDSLAFFIGAVVLEEPTILKEYAKAFDEACGTSFATS